MGSNLRVILIPVIFTFIPCVFSSFCPHCHVSCFRDRSGRQGNMTGDICKNTTIRTSETIIQVALPEPNLEVKIECWAAYPLRLKAKLEYNTSEERRTGFNPKRDVELSEGFPTSSRRSQCRREYLIYLWVVSPVGYVDCIATENSTLYQRMIFFPVFEEPAVVETRYPKRVIPDEGAPLIPCLANYPHARPVLKSKPHITDINSRVQGDKFLEISNQYELFSYDPTQGFRLNETYPPEEWSYRFYECELGNKSVQIYPQVSQGGRRNVQLKVNRTGKVIHCVYEGKEPYMSGFLVHKPCLTWDSCDLAEDELEDSINIRESLSSAFPLPPMELTSERATGKAICGYFDEYWIPTIADSIIYFVGFDDLVYTLPSELPPQAVLRLNLPSNIFSDTEMLVLCATHTFVTRPHIRFTVKNATGFPVFMKDHPQKRGHKQPRTNYIYPEKITFREDMVEVSCSSRLVRSFAWVEVSHPVSKIEKNPTAKLSSTKKVLKSGALDAYLFCEGLGYPEPQVVWEIPSDVPPALLYYGPSDIGNSTLRFAIVNEYIAGNYTCKVKNEHGVDTVVQEVKVLKANPDAFTSAQAGAIAALVTAGTILCFLIVIIACWKVQRRRKVELAILKFIEGHPSEYESPDYVPAKMRPFDTCLNYDQLEILPDIIHGKGHFGIVYGGKLKKLNAEFQVAVKTVKNSSELDKLQMLLDEIKIMQVVGDHKNIIKYHGALVGNIPKGELYVALELSSHGNLEKYLKEAKPFFQNSYGDTRLSMRNHSYHNDHCNVSTLSLLQWCQQIASGMQYLGAKRIVHRDLAARNVLLFKDHVAKISDFGLAIQLPENRDSIEDRKVCFSWKWAAIESLKYKEFSHMSDVWSFGVTAWEIFSLGADPYQGIRSNTTNFVNRLASGELRLPKPAYGTQAIYGMLTECWNAIKCDRPDFSTLERFFANQEHKLRKCQKPAMTLSTGSDNVFPDDCCDEGYHSPDGSIPLNRFSDSTNTGNYVGNHPAN